MKLICDCFEIGNLSQYAKSGIKRIIVSMPKVAARPARVYKRNEVKEAAEKAHDLGLEIGMNMLNFMMEDETEMFRDALLFCRENKIDRIYFSDMGVYQLAREMNMEKSLIYQPTTLIASSSDANEYLKLGIDKVVLSREITLEDLKSILSSCKGCEVSVFGYNAMMHSKRRLLSSYFEFTGLADKSSSKDLYLMEENRDEKMPVFQDETGTHILSGHVFCLFKEISELHNCDFRIEGIHLKEEIVLQAAEDIQKIISHEADGKMLFEKYQKDYPEYALSDGFMYKKTSLVKEAEG